MNKHLGLFIACVVLSQKHIITGYRTLCQGNEVNDYVVLDQSIEPGQRANYRPFIFQEDEEIHGKVLSIDLAPPSAPAASSDTGKSP